LYKLLNLAEERAKHKLTVSFGNTTVLLWSDDQSEIVLLKNYFNPLWGMKTSSDEVNDTANQTNSWNVICGTVKSFAEEIKKYTFRYEQSYMYDFSGVDICENKGNYTILLHSGNYSGLTIFLHKERTIFYLREEEHKKTVKNPFYDNMHIIKLIKEPINVMSKYSGYLPVHCSAFEYFGEGIMAAGKKGAGKTTLLMQMLAMGANYTANDSIFAKKTDNNSVDLYGYPLFIRLGDGTLQDIPVLKSTFEGNYLERGIFSIGNELRVHGKVQVSMTDMEKIIGSECLIRTTLNHIIFPKLEIERKNCSLKPLSTEESLSRLRDSVFNRGVKNSWLPIKDLSELDGQDKDNFEEIFENIPPAYEYSYGDASTNPAGYLVDALGLNNKRKSL
jgi:hypothetical protein